MRTYLTNLGNGLKRNTCHKKLLKIAFKDTMGSAYQHIRKDEEYANYKEALNAVTYEISQPKRNNEQTLACKIHIYSNTVCAYIRSKQTVRDKVQH